MAYRLVKPSTSVGALVNFWRNASDKLWAGSVEMICECKGASLQEAAAPCMTQF